jgi:hypothetical protein
MCLISVPSIYVMCRNISHMFSYHCAITLHNLSLLLHVYYKLVSYLLFLLIINGNCCFFVFYIVLIKVI